MTDFSMMWDLKVKQLAKNCVNYEFIKLIAKGENNNLTTEEETEVTVLSNDIKDPYGMWYISDMIWRVEHALCDNREAFAKLAVCDIYNTISKESYWTNIFKNDLSTDEAKNIKELEIGLKELINVR